MARRPTHAIACCYRVSGDGVEVLTIRSRSGGWTLPKGHLDPGESPAQTAVREASEEAGVEGDLDPHPLLWVRIPGAASPWRWSRVPAYALRVRSRGPSQEPWRTPRWRSTRGNDALRVLARPWPSRWRVRTVEALVRRVER